MHEHPEAVSFDNAMFLDKGVKRIVNSIVGPGLASDLQLLFTASSWAKSSQIAPETTTRISKWEVEIYQSIPGMWNC
jgi:hypothetical protein